MPLTPSEASRRRTRDALSALRMSFESVPVVETEWRVSSDAYERTRERHEAGTVGGAGTWTTRDDGAVLLVRDAPGEPWGDPGGKHESGESLVETAVRETREETGVSVSVDGVGFVQRVRVFDASDDSRPALHRAIPVFEATPEADRREPTPGPNVAAARWHRRRPENLSYDALDELSFPDD